MTDKGFSYNAWLQPYYGEGFEVVGEEGFAADECRRLLGRAEGRTVSLSAESGGGDGYSIKGKDNVYEIIGQSEAGLLYGVYDFAMRVRRGEELDGIDVTERPVTAMRVLNHWDNMDGSIERGYAGRSLFFDGGKFAYDAVRLADYARLLASVGINQISLNNVNVTGLSAKLVTETFLPDLAKVADIFRPFGVRLVIAVHFESPRIVGKLDSIDPTDAAVARWWADTADLVYKYIPDLAGFLMKADSEFRSGPASLGRTQAEGANPIARALKKHGGVLYWRCFVYNCTQDWRDTKTDRPKAAYDNFFPLDGQFDDNVILQIKNGPVDFQAREPNSPLLGAMANTRQGIEVQVTQEYTGQQRDLFNLAVLWEEVFTHPVDETRGTRDLMGKELEMMAGVANVGNDMNWTGHLLAQCNLFAFGRMAWNPSLTAGEVTREWVKTFFNHEPHEPHEKNEMQEKIYGMMMESRYVYEKYTAPLGIGWMVNIGHHYGPSVDGYEYMKWGTYHRADTTHIGVDRTEKGTGFTKQYRPYVRDMYENLQTCPDELVLFFHRLPYDYVLKSGKTVLQHIYDSRFDGYEGVEKFIEVWEGMRESLPDEAHESVAERLKMQLDNAREWRDAVNSYFYRKTGVDDIKNRLIYR
jgi:alpha-glucuronidase